MKRMLWMVVVSGLLVGAMSVRAGEGCGAAGKGKDKTAGCAAMFSKLNLTADQKAKIDALCADCQKSGCTKEKHAKVTAALKDILTAEQYKQWQADCEKAKGKGECPMTKKKASGKE